MDREALMDINGEKSFQGDLEYIRNDVIAKQKNGAYCKFSRPLQCITKYDITEESYRKYWLDQYKHSSKERKDAILKEINEKFKDCNLTDLDKLIELQKQCNDKDTTEILQHITTTKKAKAPRLEFFIREDED